MSTIKVNKIENTATADGGIAIDATGHVQIDGVQLPTAGALSNRNIVINGAMQVAQRGTTSSSTNDYCSLDRFKIDANQGAWEFNQESLSSGDPYNLGFRYFARLKNTTASTANDRRRRVIQSVEAQNLAQSGWNYASSSSYVTFSFWVRSSVAGTYYFSLQSRDQSPNKSYVFGETLVADTWTKVEKTIPGNSSLVITNDNGEGMRVIFSVDNGTSFTGSLTLDQWADFNNNVRTPDTSTGWTSTLNATFDVTGVQIEVGEKATAYSHLSYGDELARCQRYYYNHAEGNAKSYATASYYSSTLIAAHVHFPTTMRAAPTLEVESGTNYYRAWRNGTSDDFNNMTITRAHGNGAALDASGTGASGTAGHGAVLSTNNASSSIAFTAEL